MMDEEHQWPAEMEQVLLDVQLDEEELRGRDSASAWNLLAVGHFLGWGGLALDREEAFRCWCRAADKGHAFSLRRKAWRLRDGLGVADWEGCREAEALKCLIQAADAGCRHSMKDAAALLLQQHRHFEAAHMYARHALAVGDRRHLRRVQRQHGEAFSALGVWNPRDKPLQLLVPPDVRHLMYLWMLVAHRKRLPRYVSILVASFVCTKE